MNDLGKLCADAIAVECGPSPGAGWRGACDAFVAQHAVPQHEQAGFYGRVSEALLHRGHGEAAVECARIAFELRPQQEEIVKICAWVFSNSGCDAEAAAAYERLLELRPDW